ncbi:unnamed protein product [Rotaria sordida]|uniref:Uncharacterized protein n=1 Tax=Rotaria sordida TaxID=392033 RepID=A0A818ZEG6_9BILA|nr:unnamed protein product [Rotaria sordida]
MFLDSENSIEEIESVTNLFWLQFYFVQHYDYLSDTNKAFEYIDQVIANMPGGKAKKLKNKLRKHQEKQK